jgi:predicted nucleotidyltransferase
MSDIGAQIAACTEILRRYGAKRIVLFGSAVRNTSSAADIDLASEGIPPARFFLASNEVQSTGDRRVDLVDLGSIDDRMKTEILSRGRMLYQSPDDAAEQVEIAASQGRQILDLIRSLPSASLGPHAGAALAMYLIQLDAIVESLLKRALVGVLASPRPGSRLSHSLLRRPLRSWTRKMRALPPSAADWVERLRIFRNQYIHRREGKTPDSAAEQIAADASWAFEDLVNAAREYLTQHAAQPFNHARRA